MRGSSNGFCDGMPMIMAPQLAKGRQMTFGHDTYEAMPKGPTVAAWFRCVKGVPCCYLLELDGRGRASAWTRVVASFDSTVAAGTVVVGVLLTHAGRRFFSTFDIRVYAGRSLEGVCRQDRDSCIAAFLRRTSAANYAPSFVTFGAPPRAPTRKAAMRLAAGLPYEVTALHATRATHIAPGVLVPVSAPQRRGPRGTANCVMRVRASADQDVYTLVCSDGDASRTACVQTLEKSAQLNRMFRRIPETDDIDRQELSEDEDTFENVAPDRHLAGGDIPMECTYAERFRKWIPVRPTKERIWSSAEVAKLEPLPKAARP